METCRGVGEYAVDGVSGSDGYEIVVGRGGNVEELDVGVAPCGETMLEIGTEVIVGRGAPEVGFEA